MEDEIRHQILREQAGEPEPREHDKNHELYKNVSELGLPTDRIPQDILQRANKIFSKHSTQEVREWSDLLMKNY